MISWRAVIGWGCGLWLATGIEAVIGHGVPGPVFLFALAAGLSSGAFAGAIVGGCAGLCDSVLQGTHSDLYLPLYAIAGIAAHYVGTYFARRHLLIAMLLAGLGSLCLVLLFGLSARMEFGTLSLAMLMRGIENSLWMFAIYGIVLVLSAHRSAGISSS